MRQCLKSKRGGGGGGKEKGGGGGGRRRERRGMGERGRTVLFPSLSLWVPTVLKLARLPFSEKDLFKQPGSLLVTLTDPSVALHASTYSLPKAFLSSTSRSRALAPFLCPPERLSLLLCIQILQGWFDCFLFCSHTSLKILSISWLLILPRYCTHLQHQPCSLTPDFYHQMPVPYL